MTLKATVLVVDDEPGMRFSLEDMLTHDGHEVVTADSGKAALECIAAQEFDLALIDLKMEGIGGMQVLSALHQQSPETAVIVLTAYGSLETVAEALRQGAHDYLFKPCRMVEIQESVRTGLLRRQRELQARAMSQFASDVSHELRNLITSIDLHLYLLEHSKLEKRAYHLDIVRRETKQMQSLTESILTLSQLKAGTVRVTFAPEDLNALVEQVVTAHQARAETAGLELIFDPGAALPPVRAARDQLTQVVDNLVTNAINYTPAGQVRVSTYLDAERGQACLQVQDTGIGIELEDLPYLFERFYRGLRANQSGIPGTGLGLAIVREIVNLHGGEIKVESPSTGLRTGQVDEGSTFRVWLPLERCESR